MDRKSGSVKVLAEDDCSTNDNQSVDSKRTNMISSTLQRGTVESEGRIVLRRTGKSGLASRSSSSSNFNSNTKNLMLSGLPTKKISSVNSSVAENDDRSISTTTSDVSSDDDAASIVSRLSKIVVEQEEILTTESKQSPSPQYNQATLKRSVSSNLVNQLGNNNLRPKMSERKSLVVDRNVSSNRGNLITDASRASSTSRLCHHPSPVKSKLNDDNNNTGDNENDDKIEENSGHTDQSNLCSSIRDSSSSLCLPKINVINDNDNNLCCDIDKLNNLRETGKRKRATNKQKQNKNSVNERRTRAKSVVEAILGEKQQVLMRRNESSGYLPERGDIRDLENSRANLTKIERSETPSKETNDFNCFKQQKQVSHNENSKMQVRPRSNTAGSTDRRTLFGNNSDNSSHDESMLNIRRSAWTLLEFDQTYDGSRGNLPHPSTPNDSSPELSNVQQQLVVSKSGSEKLLKKVSKNAAALNLNQKTQTNCCSIDDSPKQATTNFSNHRSDDPIERSAEFTNLTAIDYTRRPSQTFSISSLASSNSFYKLFGTGFGRRSKFQNSKGNSADDENDKDKSSCSNIYSKLSQYIPIIDWIFNYNFGFFWGDLTAGTAVAVLNISTSLSSALVAGTDFGVAFRASIVNTFIYAILCSSKHTSFGSWSIMSQMLLVSVTRALSDELILSRLNMGPTTSWEPVEYERWRLNIIIMYTFLIGLIQLVCGILNLGNILASFIPEALCSSLITATAFTMAVGQLANMGGTSNRILFSIEKNTTELWADLKNPPVDITDLFSGLFRWAKQIRLLFKYNEQINFACIIVSIISVLLLYINQYVFQKQLKRLFNRNILLPSEMILLVIMIIVSNLLGLKENYKVTTCGPINIDFVVPDVPDLKLIRELWFGSVATALISYTMVYVMAKTYSNKLNYDVDFNQELIACGAGNLVGGLFEALPATASFSRTAGQVEAGGQTQMASIINCIVLVALAQLFGRYVAELPVCVMAATLFFGFVRMMGRFLEVFKYWKVCKVDFAIWMVTFLAILTSDIVNGFVYGFVFSILTMLYRAQNRRCYMLGSIENSDVYVPLVKYPLAQEVEGIKIFQFCGPIHYVCADLFERLLRHKTRVNVKKIMQHIIDREIVRFNPRDMNLPTHIILDFSMISYIDSAGVHIIKKIIEDYRQINVTILIAALASHVATVVKSDPSLWNAYKDRFYVTLADAVHFARRDYRLKWYLGDHNNVKVIVA